MVNQAILQNVLNTIVNLFKNSNSTGVIEIKDKESESIWEWVYPIFLEEQEETRTLRDFKKNPEDELNQQSIILEIQKYLRDNPEKGKKLLAILEQDNDTNQKIFYNMNHSGAGDNVGGDKNTYNYNK